MTWIISLFVAVVVSGVIFVVGRVTRNESATGTPGALRGLLLMVGAGALFLVWVGVSTVASSLRQVEAGHVGVVYQFGEIVSQKSEGLQFIAPWQTMKVASVQVQRKTFENLEAFSKETQDISVTVAVNYSVAPAKVQNLYRTVGVNWFDVLVQARLNNFLKEEMVKYETTEIAPNREKIRNDVRLRLASELAPFSVTVTDLLIENIDFRPEFKSAIVAKQVATQDALREQEKIKQRKAEADQAIETAKGEAESTKLRAQGQADANRLLAASLTPEVIQFQAVQKLSDKIQIAIIPSGQGIIIDPATLLAGKKP